LQILHIQRDMVIQLAPMTNNTAIIPSANGGPIAQYLVQQPSATWGLGRISHFYRGYYNYIYDTSACTNTLAYVLDTGIRTTHVEFGGRASWGANFVTGSPNTDEKGHGTHVTGTIIGSSVGVCKNGKAIAVKVLDKTGSGTWSGLMAGMQWAYNNAKSRGMLNRSVQSISIGGGYYATVNNFVNSIVSQGMTVVVAAGNNGLNTGAYSPSSAASAITVGATDSTDNRAYFSNYGSLVDIFAPGVSVLSSYFTCDTCYYYMDGTSMATPHVSGLSLYFIAKEGIAGPAAVINRLVSASIKNYVVNALGSPNRLAYNADGY
jgi:subtilisin family serine protease